jgi:hypothetical protein
MEKLSTHEKRENLVAHLSVLADLEERRGGLSHFRLILSVGREVSIEQHKALVNAYLRENFPLCPAFVAIHDDTEHRHAHVYVYARQLNNRRVNLGQHYFKLDESWMSICAAQLGDPKIYEVHMELKEKTLEWKKEEKKARANGEAIPPKPDRWADHHDTLLTWRPFDDQWCGRLHAQMRVAEIKVTWLEATHAQAEEVSEAHAAAAVLRGKLDSAAQRRSHSKREGKRHLPPEILTVMEARELQGYARDLREMEKGKETNRRETVVPEPTVRQSVLVFNAPVVVAGEGQSSFDFHTLPGVEPSGESTRPPVLDAHERSGGKRETEARLKATIPSKATMPVPTSSPDDAARTLGRELVAEAKLAMIEVRLSAERSRRAKMQLKGELSESRHAHAQARQEAGICRSILTAQKLSEPSYHLTSDERVYLTIVSEYVPEALRERIAREVERAQIIPDRDELVARGAEDVVPQEEVERREKAGAELPPAVEKKQPSSAVDNTQRHEPARDEGPPREVISSPPARSPKGVEPQTLPDEEVQRLLVARELASGRVAVLRAEENSLAVMPHLWVSPAHGLTLAQVEQQITESVEQKKHIEELSALRERIRDELVAERGGLPLRRQAAEVEASTLEKLLSDEASARHRLGLRMPDAEPAADELGEMMRNAAASRDPHLLVRVYKIGLGQALRSMQQGGGAELLISFAAKMAGVEFMAEVRASRSERMLSEATVRPEKLALPAKDETGRDIMLTLRQTAPPKGVTGFFKKMVEKKADRLLREQLVEVKDASIRYLSADSASRTAFHEAAQEIARECRETSCQLGYRMPAVPILSRAEIAEARDEARMLTSARSERWYRVAT